MVGMPKKMKALVARAPGRYAIDWIASGKLPTRDVVGNDVALRADGISRAGRFTDVSFELRRGEVLGFFGLKGAGRSELFMSIFGADAIDSGDLYLEGGIARFKKPEEAIRAGLGLVTEDRKFSGIFPGMDIKNNIAMSNMKSVSGRFGTISGDKMKKISSVYVKKLGVKTTSNEQQIRRLSGGNQQKVMISRWLHTDSRVLVLDEPTKGVDIGAKQDILTSDDIDRAGEAKTLMLIGNDGVPEALEAVRAGELTGTIAQKPYLMGYAAVEAAIMKLEGKTPGAKLATPIKLVVKSDCR